MSRKRTVNGGWWFHGLSLSVQARCPHHKSLQTREFGVVAVIRTQRATHEIVTTVPLASVVARVLAIAGLADSGPA